MFCNHGLADTLEWLLLWPWDPKLDNFRIGEHTFSEGAGGLKPKTVYRSTFNIGKKDTRDYSSESHQVPRLPRKAAASTASKATGDYSESHQVLRLPRKAAAASTASKATSDYSESHQAPRLPRNAAAASTTSQATSVQSDRSVQ